MQNQSTDPARGARAAAAARVARELTTITPEAVEVHIVPVHVPDADRGPRRALRVWLFDAHRRPVGNLAAARAALRVIRQQHSRTDWSVAHRYDVRAGRLSPLDLLAHVKAVGEVR